MPDQELGGDEAITLITSTHVRIRISRTTMERARMTIAHELMHGVLHKNEQPLARARVETHARIVPAHISVERQANVGASALLITGAMLGTSTSPTDLAERFLVSLAAADIRWEQHQKQLHRSEVHASLRALSTELKTLSKPKDLASASALICPTCGERCLLPIGVRYMCVGVCDRILDNFADGDGPLA